MSAIQEDLVGHACGDANEISRSELLTDASLDGAVALLMRRNRFTVHQRATHKKRRGAGLDEDHVHLCFMHFGLTISFAVSEHKILIGKILDVTHREMTGIGSGVSVERLCEAA